MNDAEAVQFEKMTEQPVRRVVLSLAVPTMLSMLITAIYNTADTFFVAKLGTSAAGAVGVVFSMMALIQSVGFTIGLGSGSLLSRLLGSREVERAQAVANSALFAGITLGTLIAALGLAFLTPLMHLLGATETILPYACAYGRFILLGTPFSMCTYVLNNLLRAEGKSKFALFGIMSGGILNCLLDPLFIFGLRLGAAGAAMATSLCQAISFCVLLSMYLRGKTIVKFRPAHISRTPKLYLSIVKNGMPSLCRQGLSSVSSILLNLTARGYGDMAVAAMSIVSKVFMALFSSIIGFGQGCQPVAGYNYSAKKYARVYTATHFMLTGSVAILTAVGGVCYLLAPQILRLFSEDPDVIRVGITALRAQCLAMPLVPIGVTCNMTFQAIGKSWLSTFTSSLRQGLFFIPLILILPRFFGLSGMLYTQAIAEVGTALVSFPFLLAFLRDMKRKST